jgi:hypothetical protein
LLLTEERLQKVNIIILKYNFLQILEEFEIWMQA